MLAVLKIDWGVRFGELSVIVPSGWKFLHKEIFLLDKCVEIVVVFCIADDLTSEETVEDGLWVAWRSM